MRPSIEVKEALQKLRLFNASSQPSASTQCGRTGAAFNYNAHFLETTRDNILLNCHNCIDNVSVSAYFT